MGWHNSTHTDRRTDLTDAHVGPGTHVVRLQVQGFLIRGNGFPTLAGVSQRGTQLVPQGVVLGPHLQGRSEG